MAKNEYGLDTGYFGRYFELMLRDHKNYTPDEMARSLLRMSLVADDKVIKEDEFKQNQEVSDE